MTIPPLVNGILPPGPYAATLSEVRMAFDQPGSNTRSALDKALEHTAALIWSLDTGTILSVNGSYVTSKLNPLDVDVAIRSDVWDDSRFAAAFSAAYPGEEALVDCCFNPQRSAQHMEDLFRDIQESNAKEGISRLIP